MNFFSIANKEADQDHFFHWLLMSYNSGDEVERSASQSFYRLLLGERIGTVIDAKVKIQADFKGNGRIDFLCFVKTKNAEFLVAIEDKKTAPIRNDLCGYKSYVEGHWEELLERLGVPCAEVPQLVFVVLKTSPTISKHDRDYSAENQFSLIDRDRIVNALKSHRNHYLIGAFLEKLETLPSDALESFSRRKGDLCECLKEELDVPFCKHTHEGYRIYFSKNRDRWIEMNDFSLVSPQPIVFLCGVPLDGVLNYGFVSFRLKRRKCRAKKKLILHQKTTRELVDKLRDVLKLLS